MVRRDLKTESLEANSPAGGYRVSSTKDSWKNVGARCISRSKNDCVHIDDNACTEFSNARKENRIKKKTLIFLGGKKNA